MDSVAIRADARWHSARWKDKRSTGSVWNRWCSCGQASGALFERRGDAMTTQSKANWRDIPDPKTEKPFELPAFVRLEDFLAESIEMPEVLIEGLIRRRSVVLLASGSKSYKTWAALHCALCVSQGVP